ncbi:hypothetical protein O6H91_18G016000 [Diphasiastrum complanatum]|uniref:Uncharacterized protein n=1 Tax=Diphasiastrum complanatum TaxID=34168 RepID=A0ACC2AYH3_DIPCM|nr:hypothetical protein O6H91_18G016000 [Diphasiastrum complanatum]
MTRNGCLLCAPLVAESVDEMLSKMRAAKKNGGDVVELRVDYIQGFVPETDLPRLISGRVLPVIVTYRPKWEGGNFEGDEVFRVEALRKAISLGADVELQIGCVCRFQQLLWYWDPRGSLVGFWHQHLVVIHNTGFQDIGYNAIYVPYLVDDMAEFLEVYSGSDFSGFSVSIPFKEDALRCCDEVDPFAQAIGAVNTIIRRDGKLIGYNTDCEAAISAIEDALRGRSSSLSF